MASLFCFRYLFNHDCTIRLEDLTKMARSVGAYAAPEVALDQVCQGTDIVTELEFLTSFCKDPAEVSANSHHKNKANGDIGVQDITVTVCDVDIADGEGAMSLFSGSNSRSSSRRGVGTSKEDDEDFEVDLGCGELSQWGQRPATSSPIPLPLSSSPPSALPPHSSTPLSHTSQGILRLPYSHLHHHHHAEQAAKSFSHKDNELKHLCDSVIYAEKLVKYVFMRRFGQDDLEDDESHPAHLALMDPVAEEALYKRLDTVIRR
jgi:hypothetical protein